MGVLCIHAGRADRLDFLIRQLGGRETLTAFPEAPELLISAKRINEGNRQT